MLFDLSIGVQSRIESPSPSCRQCTFPAGSADLQSSGGRASGLSGDGKYWQWEVVLILIPNGVDLRGSGKRKRFVRFFNVWFEFHASHEKVISTGSSDADEILLAFQWYTDKDHGLRGASLRHNYALMSHFLQKCLVDPK